MVLRAALTGRSRSVLDKPTGVGAGSEGMAGVPSIRQPPDNSPPREEPHHIGLDHVKAVELKRKLTNAADRRPRCEHTNQRVC